MDYGRDFLADDNSPQDESLGRDFLAEPDQETFKESLSQAPFRVADDLYQKAYHVAKNIPEYYKNVTSAPRHIGEALRENPQHAIAQLLAGVPEMGHKLINMPASLVDYGVNRLHLLPESASQNVLRQPEISGDINATFGTPQNAGEEALRFLGRNALDLLGAGGTIKALNPMNLTSRGIAKNVVKAGDRNKGIYNKIYNNFWKEAEAKGFGDMSHAIKDIDIETLRKYSPKNKISKLEDFIEKKDIRSAHDAKSDLMKIKRGLDKKDTLIGAEKKQYDAVNDAIHKINENMFKDAKGNFHPELARKYANIQKGYANKVVPYKNKAISKYKRREIGSKELVNSLSGGEFRAKRGWSHPAIGMRAFVKEHPFISAALGAPGALWLYHQMFGSGGESQ